MSTKTEEIDDDSVRDNTVLNETIQSQIKRFAKSCREVYDILYEEKLLAELRSLYNFNTLLKSHRVKQLIREGCFDNEDMQIWHLSDEYTRKSLEGFSAEQLAHIEELKRRREQLNRLVRDIISRLAREVFPEFASVLENEAKKKSSDAKKKRKSLEKKKPPATPATATPATATPATATPATATPATATATATPAPAPATPATQALEVNNAPASPIVNKVEVEESGGELKYEKYDYAITVPKDSFIFSSPTKSKLLPADIKRYVLEVIGFLKSVAPHLHSVYEPYHGDGTVCNVLSQNEYEVMVQRDMFTLETSCDFLNDELPEHYDIIITQMPLKESVLNRLYDTLKPFCVLCPIDIVAKYHHPNGNGFRVLIPKPNNSNCVWFLGNFDCDGLDTSFGFEISYL